MMMLFLLATLSVAAGCESWPSATEVLAARRGRLTQEASLRRRLPSATKYNWGTRKYEPMPQCSLPQANVEPEVTYPGLHVPNRARTIVARPFGENATDPSSGQRNSSAPAVPGFSIGDRVEVWSHGKGKWYPDGVVSEIANSGTGATMPDGRKVPLGSLRVKFNNKHSKKWIEPRFIERLLRLPAVPNPFGDERISIKKYHNFSARVEPRSASPVTEDLMGTEPVDKLVDFEFEEEYRLPDGWEKMVHMGGSDGRRWVDITEEQRSGKQVYYHDTVTRKTQWDFPTLPAGWAREGQHNKLYRNLLTHRIHTCDLPPVHRAPESSAC